MITDTLEYLPKYKGLHPALDAAIDYVLATDLTALPNGKTVVDGTRIFINVMDAELRKAEGATFEYHKKYADLQIDLTGAEHWGWTAAGTPEGGFDAEADCGFVSGAEQASGILGEGRFAIFFPGEAHKPSCMTEDCKKVHKAVVKIEMA